MIKVPANKKTTFETLSVMIQRKVKTLQKTAYKGVYSSTASSPDGRFNPNTAVIKLTRYCTKVDTWYLKENIQNYVAMINFYEEYIETPGDVFAPFLASMSTFVGGWSDGKVVTMSNIQELEDELTRLTSTVNWHNQHFWVLLKVFNASNSESGFVDRKRVNLYKLTDSVEYRKLANNLTKNKCVDDVRLSQKGGRAASFLDLIISMLDVLNAGSSKLGKGPEFDMWKHAQHSMAEMLLHVTDLIEKDARTNDNFYKFSRRKINFKVYPRD